MFGESYVRRAVICGGKGNADLTFLRDFGGGCNHVFTASGPGSTYFFVHSYV